MFHKSTNVLQIEIGKYMYETHVRYIYNISKMKCVLVYAKTKGNYKLTPDLGD